MLRLLLILAVAVVVGPAFAQSSPDASVAPLSSARLDRLVRLLVDPTPEELGAISRLHEAYLDRFRAEIAPDAARISGELAGTEPADERHAVLLRSLEAVEVRVAEADAAFFRAAADAVAEPRRPGLARVAAARERHRSTRGIRADAAVLISNGTGFVDLVDMIAREADDGEPAARAGLAAFAAAESDRLTGEARAVASATRDGLARWLPALRAFESAASVRDPAESERRARQSASDATESGRALRAALRAHHAGNRSAVERLATVLGERRYAAVRERAVLRALGEGAFGYLGNERAAALDAVLRRARRDPSLSPSAAAAVESAELLWRATRAATLEEFLAALDAADTASWATTFSLEESAAQDATVRAIEELGRHDRVFADALAAALGVRAEAYFDRIGGADAMSEEAGVEVEPEQWVAKSADAIDGASSAGPLPMRRSFGPGACEPILRDDLLEALALTGTAVDGALLETVYESWLADWWNARVEPLDLAFRKATGRSSDMEDDGRQLEPREVAAVREAGMRLAGEIDAAESALRANLAGALGTPADAPAWTLLSLRGLGAIPAPDAIDSARGDAAVVPDPVRVFAGSGASPEEVRAVLADDPVAWRTLAAEARRANESFVSILERSIRLEAESSRRVIGSAAERAARSESIAKEHFALVDGVKDRVWSRFAESTGRAIASPERRAAFARALQRETYPAFFAAAESAEPQLDRAASIADLDDDLRARIDALRAEYLAVFEELSGRMIALARTAQFGPTGGSDEYGRRMADVERIGLDRRERTARTLAELRRLLGDERARRVPGLLRRDEPPAGRSAWEIVADDD
ncbi:MAG: hypothetical protein RL325_827 [Planctomycetota bacterium]